jgi:hypothetical protein
MNMYAMALVAVTSTSIGQLLLKAAALSDMNVSAARQRWVKFGLLVAGYSVLLFSVLISAYVLRVMEVNVLVSLTALSYPLVVGSSLFLFAERLTRTQWLGLWLVCGGVALYNLA